MSFLSKLLDFGIKAMDVYLQSQQSSSAETDKSKQPDEDDEPDSSNEYESAEEEEDEFEEEEEEENVLEHEFFILNKYIKSIPKVHLNKLIEQLEYARYDHSPYAKQNRENRKRYYRQIRQTINKFAIPYHRQKAQTAYSTICETMNLQELPSYELSYIFRHDSNLCNDIREACDMTKPHDIANTSTRYALVVVLNLISYEDLY